MRISDNPSIGQTQMTGPETANDLMLLTDVNDLTSGGAAKDKKITLGALATYIIYRYARLWGTTDQANVNGGETTFFGIAGTKYVSKAATNFNDFVSPGKYYVTRPSNYTSWENAPGINGWLEVYHNATDPAESEATAVKKQIFHRQGGQPNTYKGEYFRMYSSINGSYQWSDWKQYSTGFSYLTPKSQSGTFSAAGSSNKTILDTGSLSPGVYLLIGGAQYESGSTGAYIAIGFSESNNGNLINESQIAGPSQGQSHLQCSYLVDVTAAKTFYLNVYHNSSSAMNIKNGYITMVKLGDTWNEGTT